MVNRWLRGLRMNQPRMDANLGQGTERKVQALFASIRGFIHSLSSAGLAGCAGYERELEKLLQAP